MPVLRYNLSAYKYLKGELQENGGRLFSSVSSDKTRSTGHKPERRLHVNVRKKKVTETPL